MKCLSGFSNICIHRTWQLNWRLIRTPTDTELQDILRLIYVQILDIDSGGNDEIYAKDRLRTGVIEDPAQSDLAWGALINICTQFAVSRSGGDRTTLQNLLYRECISLKPVRSYQADIEKLREYSYATVAALSELD